MTISEKILARASGKDRVTAGEYVTAKPDIAVFGDPPFFLPTFIRALKEIGVEKVFDPEKVAISFDHFSPPKDIPGAEGQKTVREWVKEQGIKYFYDHGRGGICHQLMAEAGHARPGMLYAADDTHAITLGALGAFAVALGYDMISVLATGETWFKVPESYRINVTGRFSKGVMSKDLSQRIIGDLGAEGALYKVLEFSGSAIREMSIDGRMALCNSVNNAGAKTGIINPDEKTMEYMKGRAKKTFKPVSSDPDSLYEKKIEYDVSKLEPQIAVPPAPQNVKSIAETESVEIDQANLASCASGRMEDLRIAAKILKGRKVHPRIRMLVTPVSYEVELAALREGLIEIFLNANAVVLSPSCAGCGAILGALAAGETCIASTPLNFPGRMGSPKAKIYLGSPATVAASAVSGKITDPRKFL